MTARRASPWGQHLTLRDLKVLALVFGFGDDLAAFRAFIDHQQDRADRRDG